MSMYQQKKTVQNERLVDETARWMVNIHNTETVDGHTVSIHNFIKSDVNLL